MMAQSQEAMLRMNEKQARLHHQQQQQADIMAGSPGMPRIDNGYVQYYPQAQAQGMAMELPTAGQHHNTDAKRKLEYLLANNKNIPMPMAAPGPCVVQQGASDCDEPNVNDVLAGRGSRINNHEGNIRFRLFVFPYKLMYMDKTTKKVIKAHMCASVVDHVRSLNPPGRFFEKSLQTGKWTEMGDERGRKKAGQALREDATEIRAEVGMDNPHNTISAKYQKPSNSQKAHDTKKEAAFKAVAAAAAQLSVSYYNKNNAPSPQPPNNTMSGMGMVMGMNSPQNNVNSYGGGGGPNMGMNMNMGMGMAGMDRQAQSLRTFHPSPNLPLPQAMSMQRRFHSVGNRPADQEEEMKQMLVEKELHKVQRDISQMNAMIHEQQAQIALAEQQKDEAELQREEAYALKQKAEQAQEQELQNKRRQQLFLQRTNCSSRSQESKGSQPSQGSEAHSYYAAAAAMLSLSKPPLTPVGPVLVGSRGTKPALLDESDNTTITYNTTDESLDVLTSLKGGKRDSDPAPEIILEGMETQLNRFTSEEARGMLRDSIQTFKGGASFLVESSGDMQKLLLSTNTIMDEQAGEDADVDADNEGEREREQDSPKTTATGTTIPSPTTNTRRTSAVGSRRTSTATRSSANASLRRPVTLNAVAAQREAAMRKSSISMSDLVMSINSLRDTGGISASMFDSSDSFGMSYGTINGTTSIALPPDQNEESSGISSDAVTANSLKYGELSTSTMNCGSGHMSLGDFSFTLPRDDSTVGLLAGVQELPKDGVGASSDFHDSKTPLINRKSSQTTTPLCHFSDIRASAPRAYGGDGDDDSDDDNMSAGSSPPIRRASVHQED
jgi:hypothetical protein